MKKLLALLLAVVLVFSLAACGKSAQKDIFAKGEGVLTHEQYIAAE